MRRTSNVRIDRHNWVRYCAIMGVGLMLVETGCHEKPNASRPSPAPAIRTAIGYERAKWRLANFDELDRSVLFVSHVLVMHSASDSSNVQLRAPGWAPDPAVPDRGEDEALTRALGIAEFAAKDPSSFAELAKRYSDDVVTKDRGGSLGGIRATQLPAEFRDALAQLRPGHVSRVIRTALGFHVLQRRAAPQEAAVSGKRIVIGYRGTYGGPAGRSPARSRSEALELARKVTLEARNQHANFDALVTRYSENEDVIQHGDLGVFSVRNPGELPQEVERLSELSIGEISEPMDSRFGFEILLRTSVTPRERYAMQAVHLTFDPGAPAGARFSQASVRERALGMIASIQHDPAEFRRMQQQDCCEGTLSWTSGRGPVGVEQVVSQLEIGALASAPVASGRTFVIPRRVDPRLAPPEPEPMYELPAPDAPDFDRLVSSIDGPGLATNVRALSAEAVRALHLEASHMQVLTVALERLAHAFENDWHSPDERVAGFHAALDNTRAELGVESYTLFERFLTLWATRQLMDMPR